MIECDDSVEGAGNESRLRAGQSGNAHRDNRNDAVISRRTLLLGSAGTALAGLAGCNRLPIDEFADTRFSPQSPSTTPKPITEPPVTSEGPVPEDFEDGCGTVGTGETVGGIRDDIEFRISPIGDLPTAAEKDSPNLAFESAAPPTIERSRWISASHNQSVSSPDILQTRQDSGCTEETKQAVRKSSRTLTLNPESSRIYPGALVRLDSVWKGQMQPVIGDRAPIRISISLPATQFEGSAVRVVSSPSLSAVRDATNDLLRTVIGGAATRADVTYDMHSVYDRRQGHVDLGAHFDGFVYDFGFDFEAENEEEKSKVVVVFRQNYFTVDVDIPNAFFADGRNPSRQDAIVSSVTYGRLLLFSAESEASEERTKSALNAALGGFSGASAETGHEETLNEMTLRVRALGGSGSAATKPITNGTEGINAYLSEGAEYSATSPAFPLSYQLTYLSDFSIAEVQMRTEYTRQVCHGQRVLLRDVTFTGIDTYDGFLNRGYGLELYGLITAEAVGGTFVGSEEVRTSTDSTTESTSTPQATEVVEATQEPPTSSEIVVWRVPAGGSEMILLTEEKPYTLSIGNVFEFPVPEGFPSPTSGLHLSVELTDYDGGGDDFIGRDEAFIELFEILSSTDDSLTYSIELSENNRVRVEFTIERL